MKYSARQLKIACVVAAFGMMFAAPSFAADLPTAPVAPINLAINIGGQKTVADLPAYLGLLYKWFVGAAMVIAAFMITVGGFQYVASGGIPKYVGSAKTRIRNALIGLLLVLGSYVLLYSISPDFVNLKLPPIKRISRVELPGGLCPDTDSYQGKFKCGDIYSSTTSPAAPLAKGATCTGIGGCGSGSCLSYKDTATGTLKRSCLQQQDCPPTCAQIPSLGTGDSWQAVCGSSVCNSVIPGGCYITSTLNIADTGTTYSCAPRRKVGETCDDKKPCAANLVCGTDTGVCASATANQAEGAACTGDDQCESRFCSTLELDNNGAGKCLGSDGLGVNGAVCYKSPTDPNGKRICGDRFVCVSTGNPPGENGVCSDLSPDQACFVAPGFDCVDTTTVCQFDEGKNHGVCNPKPVAPPPDQPTA